jgi:hypothetical protein
MELVKLDVEQTLEEQLLACRVKLPRDKRASLLTGGSCQAAHKPLNSRGRKMRTTTGAS